MLDWGMVAAIAALITAIAAIMAIIIQMRSARVVMVIDLLLRLERDFRLDPLMVARRRRIGEAFLRERQVDKQSLEVVSDLEEVLHFFQLIGTLVRKGVLDRYLAWNSFYYRAIGYWCIAESHITATRNRDATIWEDFVLMKDMFVKEEARQRQQPVIKVFPNDDDVTQFLKEEAHLGTYK